MLSLTKVLRQSPQKLQREQSQFLLLLKLCSTQGSTDIFPLLVIMVVVKKGKIVDPKRPKRPLNAFMMFSIQQQDLILENNPDLKFGNVAKVAGHIWKNLSPEQIALFKERSELGAHKYRNRMAAYNKHAPSQEMLFKIYGFKPRGPRSSYNYFIKSNYGTAMRVAPSKTFGEIIRMLANMWTEMPERTKRIYQVLAKADRRRWEADMHLYNDGAFRHEGVKNGHCIKCGKSVKKIKVKNA